MHRGPHTAGDVELTDGGRYWVGQTVYTDAFDAGDTVQLRSGTPNDDRGFVTQVAVSSEGGVRFDIGRLGADSYYLTDTEGTTLALDLVTQQYSMNTTRSKVTAANSSTTITISSSRGSYTQKVHSPDLSPSELDGVFGASGAVESDGVSIPGGSNQSLSADFSGIDPGTYRLQFFVTDTTAADTTTVTVAEESQVSLASRVVQGSVGSVVRIPIRFTNAKTATLTLGSKDLNWKTSVAVTDRDGDGTATLNVDTSNIGQNGTVFSATGGDVSNVTVAVGVAFSPPSRRIAAGPYPIVVVEDGVEVDMGVMSLREPSTSLCGRDTASILQTYDDNVDRVPGLLSGMLTDATFHGVVDDDANRDYTITTGSNRRISAFASAYDTGAVEVSGVGPVNAIVVEVLKLGLDIGQRLGAL